MHDHAPRGRDITALEIIVLGAIAMVSGVGLVMQGRSNAALDAELAALQALRIEAAALAAENRQLAAVAIELDKYRNDTADLADLRERMARLRAGVHRPGTTPTRVNSGSPNKGSTG
jgi:hypothetical protein